jgi:hypothetical protein
VLVTVTRPGDGVVVQLTVTVAPTTDSAFELVRTRLWTSALVTGAFGAGDVLYRR